MDVNREAAAYQATVVSHNENIQRVVKARAALDAATDELNAATMQLGQSLTERDNAKDALIAAALDGVTSA